MWAENLVLNGSFEDTSAITAGDKLKFSSASVAHWTTDSSGNIGKYLFIDTPHSADGTNNGGYDVYGPFPATSPDGGQFVQSDGDTQYAATISQTISGLTAGEKYNVSFYQAAGQQKTFNGDTTEQWKVSLGSESHKSTLVKLPAGGNVSPWTLETLTFTATSSSEVLSFLALGTPNGLPPTVFLDGVHMDVVPEPSTMSALLIGLVSLACVRRRFKKA